jgi:hypothetical protein
MNKALKKQRRQHKGGIGNMHSLGGDMVIYEDGKDEQRKSTKISKHKQGFKKRKLK